VEWSGNRFGGAGVGEEFRDGKDWKASSAGALVTFERTRLHDSRTTTC
jgi:hypothetical protein